MTETKNSEFRRLNNEWQTKASELWAPDAKEILNLLEQNDVVFIDAQRGSGKSSFLSLQIKSLASKNSWGYGFVDLRASLAPQSDPDKYLISTVRHEVRKGASIKDGQQAIAVLDEVGHLDGYNFLRAIHAAEIEGYNKFVVIPAGLTPEVRAKQVDRLTEALNSRGKTSTTYNMETKALSESLSRELFALRGTPTEAADFIISIFPLYPNLLDRIAGLKNESKVREWFRNNWLSLYRYQRGINAEEIEEVKRKLGI